MIDLSGFETVVSESSSKGNQIKFYSRGYWIKLDNHKCYEGLAEDFVSRLEALIVDFPYVVYKTDSFLYNDDIYTGCYSYSMYGNKDVSFISLRHLFRSNNIPLSIFSQSDSIEENIVNVINAVMGITGVDISSYLYRLLLLDALVLNEDRHYMNLGVCFDGKIYYPALCFDNGSSLFCTNWTYRKTKSFEENISRASSVARPFSKFYDKQVSACVNLGASPLQINKRGLVDLIYNYSNSLYPLERVGLIKKVLVNRLKYYEGKGVYIFV